MSGTTSTTPQTESISSEQRRHFNIRVLRKGVTCAITIYVDTKRPANPRVGPVRPEDKLCMHNLDIVLLTTKMLKRHLSNHSWLGRTAVHMFDKAYLDRESVWVLQIIGVL